MKKIQQKNLANTSSRQFILVMLLMCVTYTSFAHFGSKGPFGGYVSCATTFDSIVYIGTLNGGVYQSTNSKLIAWTARPVGLKSGKITALAHTGKYLFAATADSGVFVYTGFVGSDRYWIKKNQGLTNLNITCLVAIDSITLMAGTNGGGIFKTNNRGETWVAVNNTDLHHMQITGLIKAGNRIIHSALDGGVYASDNSGLTWFDFNDEYTRDIDGTTALSYNTATDELMVYNNNGLHKAGWASNIPNAHYVLVERGLSVTATIRSISNDGATWFLATDEGLYSSRDNGYTWTAINSGLPTKDVTAIVPFQDRLVAGTRGEGIFKTSKTAPAWTVMNNGFNNLATYSMTTSGDLLVIAATERGVYVSTDLASTYRRSNTGLTDSLNVTEVLFQNGTLLASTKIGGVFMSNDTGRTWTAINTGLSNLNISRLFYANGRKFAVVSGGGVYSSLLTESQWANFSDGISNQMVITSLASYGSKFIIGTRDNGIFVKNSLTSPWQAMNTGLTNLYVTSVVASGGKIFAGTSGSGVFVSDTVAANWQPTSATAISHTSLIGLNGNFIQALAANAGYVYASYKGGLLATSDNGLTWIAGGNQFNLPSFTDVAKISFVTTRVFVTTQNNGLYSNALSELPAITGLYDLFEIATNKTLTVEPNPNNGQFSIPSISHLESWAIYNNEGKLVQQSNGSMTSWSLNLPAGFYTIQLTTTKGNSMAKFVVD